MLSTRRRTNPTKTLLESLLITLPLIGPVIAKLYRYDRFDSENLQIAPYFAKVECFCFEEQKLLAGEEVDLPLFFFIDKDFVDDPTMGNLDDIVLSYTFFRSVTVILFFYTHLSPYRARRNKQGHLEPDASEDVVDKSMGWSNYGKAETREQP